MFPTQATIDRLSERIERAFSLRCADWHHGCSTPRIWATAAMGLWQLHQENPELPLDPELYVASQSISHPCLDPWSALTGTKAGQRYQKRVHKIIRQLRQELGREIRRAENSMGRGLTLATLMKSRKARCSPLGLYILTHRAGRTDLADRVRPEVIRQHENCPLYRFASLPFLPCELYPAIGDAAHSQTKTFPVVPCMMISLN